MTHIQQKQLYSQLELLRPLFRRETKRRKSRVLLDEEDLMHDVFLRCIDKYPQRTWTPEDRPMLGTIGRNLCRDHTRHRKIEERHVQKAKTTSLEPLTSSPEKHCARNEEMANARVALRHAPPRAAEVLLRTFRGQAEEDIARSMGITQDTVRSQKRRGIRSVQAILRLSEVSVCPQARPPWVPTAADGQEKAA